MLKIKSVVIKNSIFSVLQIVLSTFCYVVIYYLILHKLGKNELGIWSIITSLPIAISVFGSGVSGCVLRYIPVHTAQNDKKAFNQIIFNGFVFNIVFGGLIVLLGYCFSANILCFLFNAPKIPVRYIQLFRISLCTFFISFITSVLLSAIDGMQLIFVRNKIVIFCSIIFCITAAIFVYYYDLTGILIAQLIQSILLLLCATVILIKVDLFDFSLMKFNQLYIKLFLTYGQGFQAISLAVLIFDPITKYFLNKYFNLSTVGIYDLASRAVTQIRVLIVSAVQVITPFVSKSNEKRELDINEMFNKINRGASLLSFILFSTLICFSMIIVGYLDENNANQYLFILILLCISYHFNIMASTAYSILMGLGKLKNIIISHILSSIINIALFFFIGKYLIDDLVVLPIAFSIVLSSEYLIFKFKKEFDITDDLVKRTDFFVKTLSVFTIVMSAILVLLKMSTCFRIILFVFHLLVLIFLVIKNDFFAGILNKISNK
jgi:O-antigen/teichoic acid export membrane protein